MTQKAVAGMIVLYIKMSILKTVVAKSLILAVVDIDEDDMDIKIALIERGATIA